jgi:hypothetical protein
MGGSEKVKRQRESGHLTVRERVEAYACFHGGSKSERRLANWPTSF